LKFTSLFFVLLKPMSKKIAIIDYQMGNLRSVQKALEHLGFPAQVTCCPKDLQAADKLILPGVGAFGDAILELRKRGLIEPIKEAIGEGKPFLGICLGLQLLFDRSYEGGEHEGLGVLRGSVRRFSGPNFQGDMALKVPHMGWNQVDAAGDACPLMSGISADDYFYFVHSYYVDPENQEATWLECTYGTPFCAAIWRDNLFATQFHPEKSQAAGLRILRNFGDL
jgi:imidazole glycerol-phosphate synthase subunit HisH